MSANSERKRSAARKALIDGKPETEEANMDKTGDLVTLSMRLSATDSRWRQGWGARDRVDVRTRRRGGHGRQTLQSGIGLTGRTAEEERKLSEDKVKGDEDAEIGWESDGDCDNG